MTDLLPGMTWHPSTPIQPCEKWLQSCSKVDPPVDIYTSDGQTYYRDKDSKTELMSDVNFEQI